VVGTIVDRRLEPGPSHLRAWASRRSAPLVATVATLLIGLDYVFLWEGLPRGPFGIWLTPSDLWGTYLASISLVHGHLTSAYAALPGSLIVMAPAAALGNALHLEVGPNSRRSPHRTVGCSWGPTRWSSPRFPLRGRRHR